jgi:hypothetical protein
MIYRGKTIFKENKRYVVSWFFEKYEFKKLSEAKKFIDKLKDQHPFSILLFRPGI